MSVREKALNQGRSAINNLINMMRELRKDLDSGNENRQAEALITLKALDSFIAEDNGLVFWRAIVMDVISEEMKKLKNMH